MADVPGDGVLGFGGIQDANPLRFTGGTGKITMADGLVECQRLFFHPVALSGGAGGKAFERLCGIHVQKEGHVR